MATHLPANTPAPWSGNSRLWVALLFGWSVLILALNLLGNSAARPLDEHEIYVARTATEMARRGDWIVPYFSGQPRLQKLPLNYWLAAAASWLMGQDPADRVDAFAARLPSAVAGALFVLLTAWMTYVGTRHWGPALGAAVLAGTSNGLVTWAHNARPEMVYATLCTAQVACFAATAEAVQHGRRALLWSSLAWLAAIAATMSKGPHYPVFLLAAIGVAVYVRTRSLSMVRRVLRPGLGAVLCVVALGAYLFLLDRRVDGLWAFWYRELFYRTGGTEGLLWFVRFYYIGALALLTLPWTLLAFGGLIWAARRLRSLPPSVTVAWFAVLVPALILSCSRGQRVYYLLPSLGACLAVTAYAGWLMIRERSWVLGRPLPVVELARGHFMAAAGVALFVMWRLYAYGQAGLLSAAAVAAGATVLAGALCAALVVWLRGSSTLTARLTATIGLMIASYAVGCTSGVFWSTERYERAAMARAIGKKLVHNIPIYALAGRIEHLIYYHDRPVRRVTHAEMALLLRQGQAYVIADESCQKCRKLLKGTPRLIRIAERQQQFSVRLVSPRSPQIADRRDERATVSPQQRAHDL